MPDGRTSVSALQLAWRHGARQRGEWWVVLLALGVAVAAVTAVTQMNERVRAAMMHQGAQTLAADLRLDLRAPLGEARSATIEKTGVATAAVATFPSAVTRNDGVTLVSVKAVEPAYPLRGAVTLRRGPPGASTAEITHGPPAGTVWVAQRVLDELQLDIGDTLPLGDTGLRIGAVLVTEPDRAPGFVNIAPRVMMAADDMAATGLLGPGSRAHYSELIAGTPEQIAAARAQLEPTLTTGESLQTPRESNRALSRALDRADIFLDLAALVAVMLAGVAIALAARQQAQSRLDEVALFKTLGAARGLIGRMLAWQLVIVGILGIGLGLLTGQAAQAGLSLLVARAFDIDLPTASLTGLWPAPATGAVLLAGFAWPALAQARATPPARVLARALDTTTTRGRFVHVAAIASVVLLAAAATRDIALTAWVVAGTIAGTLVLAAGAFGLLWLVERLRRHLGAGAGPGVRLGLASLSRRRSASILQIVAFGIGLIMLFLLVIVRGDLLAGWRADIASDAPNRFLINITPDQQPKVADFLADNGIDADFHPIVRARLTTVNGQSIDDDPTLAESAGELAQRELNLSWAGQLKADNRITSGQWWQRDDRGKALISIATSVAERLDTGIGDTLSFDIAGEPITARVTSIREIDWSSLQANFYVLFPPGALDNLPATHITSFHLPPDHHGVLASLVRQFSNISVINIAAILDQITTLIERVSLAAELVFGFTLAAGLVVLLAAMQASLAERRREAALLRALGARSRWLRQATGVECLLIGACASILAAGVAQITAIVLATRMLDLDYSWRPLIWLIAVVTATLAIAAMAVLSLRPVLRQPAWTSLRESE